MNSLATLEHALTMWAQTTLENIMHPVYLGLLRLLIAELVGRQHALDGFIMPTPYLIGYEVPATATKVHQKDSSEVSLIE